MHGRARQARVALQLADPSGSKLAKGRQQRERAANDSAWNFRTIDGGG
jgi:hypothetical protein